MEFFLYFKKIFRFIKELLLFTDSRIGVLGCSISYYLWGFILLLPGQIIYKPYYRGLKLISDNENLWSLVFLTFASLQIYNLLPFCKYKSAYIGHIVRFLSCIFSTYIFLSAISQTMVPPVAADTLVVVCLAWWDFFRYKGKTSENYYISVHKSREKCNDG